MNAAVCVTGPITLSFLRSESLVLTTTVTQGMIKILDGSFFPRAFFGTKTAGLPHVDDRNQRVTWV